MDIKEFAENIKEIKIKSLDKLSKLQDDYQLLLTIKDKNSYEATIEDLKYKKKVLENPKKFKKKIVLNSWKKRFNSMPKLSMEIASIILCVMIWLAIIFWGNFLVVNGFKEILIFFSLLAVGMSVYYIFPNPVADFLTFSKIKNIIKNNTLEEVTEELEKKQNEKMELDSNLKWTTEELENIKQFLFDLDIVNDFIQQTIQNSSYFKTINSNDKQIVMDNEEKRTLKK